MKNVTLSEKRKKWLTKKVILNTIHVSAGIFVIASVFQVAEIFISSSETIVIRVFSAFVSIAITTLMFLISGLINPDFMDIVFNMLGFKEKEKIDSKESTEKKEYKKTEKNDFEKLVDEHFVEGNNDKELTEALKVTLKILLEKRLDFHSQSLITSIKLSVSIILGLIAIIPTFFSILTGNFYLLVISAVVLVIVFAVIEQTITQRKLKKEEEERKIVGQYLKAIIKLNQKN